MTAFSDYLENHLLDQVFGNNSFTPNLQLALSYAAPGEDGSTISEPSGATGYARINVANDSAEWTTATGGQISNKNTISFGAFSVPVSGVAYLAVFDDGGTNFLGYAEVPAASQDYLAGEAVIFNTGQLVFSLD